MVGQSIAEGFKFAFSLKRITPYIILNFFLFYIIVDMFGRVGAVREMSSETVSSLAPIFGFYLFVFVLFLVLQPLFLGAMLHQARYFPKELPLKESFRFSLSAYFKTLFTLLIIFIINSFAGFIPYLWPFFLLLLATAFFYVLPAAIADKRKILDSFRRSITIFRKHPFQTFAVYILVLLVGAILVMTSFIPMVYWLAGNIFNLTSQGAEDRATLILHLSQLLISPSIIPFELIPAISSAFVSVMSIGVQTRLYFKLKKRKV
jgi:hypothetical protein